MWRKSLGKLNPIPERNFFDQNWYRGAAKTVALNVSKRLKDLKYIKRPLYLKAGLSNLKYRKLEFYFLSFVDIIFFL